MENWNIAGQEIAPGEKRRVILHPNMENYDMPATLVCGAKEGMTLLVTGGIHSGEYPGVAAVARLAREIDPAKVRGRILFIHCVNTSGFWARSPGRVPEDGFNLNGDYPGRPGGSPGERIADYFVTQLFPQADFIVDLHSGGQNEPLTPCLFFPVGAGKAVEDIAFAAAMNTDIPYLIASVATSGQYSYAATAMGIPGLLLERGHSGHCREEWIRAYQRDLRLLLQHFAMADLGERAPATAKTVCRETVYLVSEHRGLWYPAIQEGQRVEKGDLLGRVEDFYGEAIATYRAEEAGIVFYHSANLAIQAGNPLVAYGLRAHMKEAP